MICFHRPAVCHSATEDTRGGERGGWRERERGKEGDQEGENMWLNVVSEEGVGEPFTVYDGSSPSKDAHTA